MLGVCSEHLPNGKADNKLSLVMCRAVVRRQPERTSEEGAAAGWRGGTLYCIRGAGCPSPRTRRDPLWGFRGGSGPALLGHPRPYARADPPILCVSLTGHLRRRWSSAPPWSC